MNVVIALLATLLDRLVGDPDWLWRRVPHPVVWFGHAISRAEWHLNRPGWSDGARRMSGIATILILILGVAFIGALIHAVLAAFGFAGVLVEAVIASVFLAQKSLADHVKRVRHKLEHDSLAKSREAVSMIVGRDPQHLDEPGICRAAIESLAENASDGVVAPWLFLLVFGLPGLLAYKMLNTADSMIGHMDERHRAFGYGAAKLDDIANWPAARLTALLFALAALPLQGWRSALRALHTALRDASSHRSPNAGWPESAVAGALGLALGGPRRYGELEVDAPMLNAAGRRDAGVRDIGQALRLFRMLCDLLLALTFVIVLLAAA